MARQRNLYRIEAEKKIAGVCAGLAEYFQLDVTLTRAIFVVLALTGGVGIVLYGVLWLIIEPELVLEPVAVPEGSAEPHVTAADAVTESIPYPVQITPGGVDS